MINANATTPTTADPPASTRASISSGAFYRTVFISDAHLGSRSARSPELAKFLKHMRCEKLYLVGDIIDFWRLKSRAHWPMCHHDVLRKILKHVQLGTEVIFIPGNHDEAARKYLNMDFGGIRIIRDDVHETADGRRLFITHGDEYDIVVTHRKLLVLSHVGSAAYEWLVDINRKYNNVRLRFGLPRRHFSRYLKLKVKSACQFVSAFEETLMGEARSRNLDGVVCGHIHKPEIRDVDGVTYYNCGDWIEHCTALVEQMDGSIELIDASDEAEVEPIAWLNRRGRSRVAAASAAPAHLDEPASI